MPWPKGRKRPEYSGPNNPQWPHVCGLGDEEEVIMIRCGNCKKGHPTVADVKACYAEAAEQAAQAKAEADAERRNEEFFESGTDMDRMRSIDESDRERALETAMIQARERADDERAYAQKAERDEALNAGRLLDRMTGSPGRDMASPKQVNYVMDLLADREWPDDLNRQAVENMERRQISKLIDGLKGSPLRNGANIRKESPIPEVPAGRYAIWEPEYHAPMENGQVVNADIATGWTENILRFYQVDRPEEGKWKGRTFLKQLFGAPGDYRKERVTGMRSARILTRIAADPQAASIRYGKESGVCGVCHSPLTNKDSLERGIGPVCAKKRDW